MHLIPGQKALLPTITQLIVFQQTLLKNLLPLMILRVNFVNFCDKNFLPQRRLKGFHKGIKIYELIRLSAKQKLHG